MQLQDGENAKLTFVAANASAYFSNNQVRVDEIGGVITAISAAFDSLNAPTVEPVVEEARTPAVSIKKSVTPEYLICLEDGLKFKSLKRHLRTKYNLSPEEYRARWSLPADYPMTAPDYAAHRSELAKKFGLGQTDRTASTEQAEPAAEAPKAAKAPRKAKATKTEPAKTEAPAEAESASEQTEA